MSQLKGFTPCLDTITLKHGLLCSAIYGIIYRYEQGDKGFCSAAQPKMAERLGVSVATVKRRLNILEQGGYITKEPTGRTNHYRTTRKAGLSVSAIAIDNLAHSELSDSSESHGQIAQKELQRKKVKKESKINSSAEEKREPVYVEPGHEFDEPEKTKPKKRKTGPQTETRKFAQEHFKTLTKLPIPTSQSTAGALWYSPLRELCKLGEWDRKKISRLIDVSVGKMRERGLSMSSPKSIMKLAYETIAENNGAGGSLTQSEKFRMENPEVFENG